MAYTHGMRYGYIQPLEYLTNPPSLMSKKDVQIGV